MFEYNGKKYIKVNINIKDEVDQYGKDVSITVDTWKPDSEKSATPKKVEAKAVVTEQEGDLPF